MQSTKETVLAMAATGKNPLKIAFVHNRYIDYRIPFFEGLAKNFDVTFLFDQVDGKTEIQGDSFSYKILRSITAANTSTSELRLSPTLFYDLVRRKYDLFVGSDMGEISTYIAFIVSRLTRRPFILWNETWYWQRTIVRALILPFAKFMIKRSNAIVVPGSKAKEFIISAGTEPSKVFIAPNVSNVVLMKPTSKRKAKEKLGMKNKKIVLYVGRLVEIKGLFNLIEAFSKLQKEISDSFLIIAGEGEIGRKLKQLCTSLKIDNIRFTGFAGEKEKLLYYPLADVFVLPSIFTRRNAEVWGLVLNEAMSLAKPVISTTAVGGAYDLIKNDINGYMVKAGDVQALYVALKKLLKDPARAKKMGVESKKIIEERFSINHMVEGFVKAISYVTNLHYRK